MQYGSFRKHIRLAPRGIEERVWEAKDVLGYYLNFTADAQRLRSICVTFVSIAIPYQNTHGDLRVIAVSRSHDPRCQFSLCGANREAAMAHMQGPQERPHKSESCLVDGVVCGVPVVRTIG